ncbi:MAG TPA: small ribosomal subunit Rsm22 family protein [Acidothermaceae bacterium]|jgi:ribosomal protein RSM22 (predicted rRNA methylase)
MPSSLRDCIDDALAGTTAAGLTARVERLIGTYRSGATPVTPILATADDVLAYAAYRMPATYAVVRAALQQLELGVPGFQPRTLVDFGAGTGAVAWAAADVWSTLSDVTLLEQSVAAIELGKRLMLGSSSVVLGVAVWRQWRLSTPAADAGQFDVATAAYVLGELTEQQQAVLVGLLMASAPTVVVIEPGTPAGFARVIRAREALIDGGFSIAAPCPHECACPMLERGDWCHFAERLDRSRLHRSVKAGELSYEDEKFSYVAAARGPVRQPAARILRHPQLRKGLVSLELCTASGAATNERVSKSQELYKAARNARWGDSWPPN